MYELCHLQKLPTKNLYQAANYLQLVTKRRPEDFFNFEPCMLLMNLYTSIKYDCSSEKT